MEARTNPLPPIFAMVALFSQIIPDRVQRTARRVPALGRTISSLLDRAAPEGMVDVRVSRGALRGAWLRLDLRREREYWLGAYERRLVVAMSDFCRSGMVGVRPAGRILVIPHSYAHGLSVGQAGCTLSSRSTRTSSACVIIWRGTIPTTTSS
jgi:hypothetical protein